MASETRPAAVPFPEPQHQGAPASSSRGGKHVTLQASPGTPRQRFPSPRAPHGQSVSPAAPVPLTQSLRQGRLLWSQESREQQCWDTARASSPLACHSSSSCGHSTDTAQEPWRARLCSSHLQGSAQVRAVLHQGAPAQSTWARSCCHRENRESSSLGWKCFQAGLEQLPASPQALAGLHNSLRPWPRHSGVTDL